jgi:hypothetical protein
LFPFAPKQESTCLQLNADGMMTEMQKFVKQRSSEARTLVEDYNRRVEALVEREHACGNQFPVVVWAGEIVNTAREWLDHIDNSMSHPNIMSFQTPWYTVRTYHDRVYVLGAIHPSAHLQSRGDPAISALFRKTYDSVNILRQLRRKPTPADVMNASDINNVKYFIDGLDMLGIPHTDGWLSESLRHVRYLPWSDTAFVNSLFNLKKNWAIDSYRLFVMRQSCMHQILNGYSVRVNGRNVSAQTNSPHGCATAWRPDCSKNPLTLAFWSGIIALA